MPASDRLNAANTNGKALRPTLASTRTTKSTPLTPKLAAASPSLTPSSARRSAGRDDSQTSTPRSTSRSRKTRSSSTLSTPTATPTASRHDASSAGPTLSSSFSSSSTSSRRPRSVVSSVESSRSAPRLAPTSAAHSRPSSEVGARDKDARFFHASEVRSPGPTSAPMAKKATASFYQSSNAREGRKSSNASGGMPSPPLSAVERSRPRSGSQFFHADTIPEARHNAALQSPPILSPSSDPYFPPHSAPPPSGGKDSPLQPQSPAKDSIHLSYRKGASQVIRPNMHGRPPSSSMFAPVENSTMQRRRSSNESGSARFAHGKNPSLSSIDSVTTSGRQTTGTADHPGSPAGPSPLHVDITSPSTVQSPGSRIARANDDGEEKEPAGLQSPLSLPQSPAHDPPQNPLQKMNELAANARRERKVLDLEISNSSLLAINRQLEREVRKQKAELKRFRRLSRAGRLASGAGAGRSSLLSSVTEGETADFEDDNDDLEGGDEGGDEREDDGEGLHDEHDDNEELSSDESSIDEGTLSPSALAERDAKYRLQDQKRLQLDLSKHRELLGDSQKLNQSLKRCIGWTEDLIKEGRKALDYQVRASDVRLGGRILTREEEEMDDSSEEEEGPHGGSLLSAWTPPDGAMRTSAESERLTDRDSGIELEGPGKIKLQDAVGMLPAKAQQLGQSF